MSHARIAVVAAGAISAKGRGAIAYSVAKAGAAPNTFIAPDPALAAAGLQCAIAARAAPLEPSHSALPMEWASMDPACRLLFDAADQLVQALDAQVPDWRSLRIGLALGTSSAAMGAQRAALGAVSDAEAPCGGVDSARQAPYFAPSLMLREWLVERGATVPHALTTQILAACASSTVAIGIGKRWLEAERCDLVIAGGYDAVDVMVAAGFEALGAISKASVRPFRLARDGMALGEGAALLALRSTSGPSTSGTSSAFGYLLGFGISSDAVHVTAPERSGAGLARAARDALSEAGVDRVDLVSAHGTATPHNDSAEARALSLALGEHASAAVIHGMKAELGHTLGAGGALELLGALDAMATEVAPGTLGFGPVDPELKPKILERSEPGRPGTALKLSAAFGGSNAALVVSRAQAAVAAPYALRPRKGVRVLGVGRPSTSADHALVARRARAPERVLSRLDEASALVVTALAEILERGFELDAQAGVVVGTSVACTEHNALFCEKLRTRGARWVPPRQFPATSPNLSAGLGSIAFGLTGPCFAVSASPQAAIEALLVGYDLVEAGDAPQIVVVASDYVGPNVAALWSAAQRSLPEHGAVAVVLGATDVGQGIDRVRLGALAESGLGARGWPDLVAAVGLLA